MARMTPAKSACWRETLQVLDSTEQRCRGALEVLADARKGIWVQGDPPDDGDSAEVLEDVLRQVPFLVARIRELEAQLDQHTQTQRGTPSRSVPLAAERDPDVSQVPEGW